MQGTAPQRRPVVLCADDYGIAHGVSTGIEELIAIGRLTATSCMSGLPGWRARARFLKLAARGAASGQTPARTADVGLHLTLTDHAPLSTAPRLATDGRLPGLSRLLTGALAGRLPATELADEIRAQLDAFEEAWGEPPDFVDGHQHVHLLPGVREALLDELVRRYRPGTIYLRDCAEAPWRCLRRGVALPKALFLTALSTGWAQRAAAAGFAVNRGFSGLHDFSMRRPFRARMRRFLAHPGPRPLIHVHPGHVDDELRRRDVLTTAREAEWSYLASAAFLEDLDQAGVRLAPFRSVL